MTVPCDHPDAVDGIFYCIPSYFNSPHMHKDFGFVLVDTQKAISELKNNNPSMMKHAEHKFNGETVEDWLEGTSFDQPRDMGFWVYGHGRALSMNSGQASLIKVAELLKLPCFPIAVEKPFLAEIEQKFGYTGHLMSRPLTKLSSTDRT